MSSKLYQKIHHNMSSSQQKAMHDLYMSGTNWDGHSWVTWGAVEETVAVIMQEGMDIPEWTSIRYSFPKYGETVLAYVPRQKRVIAETYYGQPYWFDEISHWMPMPKIPTEAADLC